MPIPPNNNMDCLQMWKDELRLTQNALVKAEAEAQKACASYNSTLSVKAKLNIYFDNINTTIKLIDDVKDELGILLEQVDEVCEKTECTVEAMKIFHCFIKEFFLCTDGFKQNILTLITKIECLNLSGKPSIVLKCLQTLLDKLNVALSSQETILKMAINIVRGAVEIDKLLCNDECSVKNYVAKLNKYYSPLTTRKKAGDILITHKLEPKTKLQFMNALVPALQIQFPINTSSTYTTLEGDVGDIQGVCEVSKEECDTQRKEADIVRACKQNLENAIAAATEAKACK